MSFIEKVKIQAMSRGVVVLDNNLEVLKAVLIERRIRVVIPQPGMADEDIIRTLCPHRILITNNLKDFVSEVSSYEFGIIFIPQTLVADVSKAGKLISDVIIKYSLWSKMHGFVVKIDSEGKSNFQEITD